MQVYRPIRLNVDGHVAGIEDIHAHLIPLSVVERLVTEGRARYDDGRLLLPSEVSGFESSVPLLITPAFYDQAVRRAWMRERRIARQYLSVPPFFFAYGTQAQHGAALARLANDDLAAAVDAAPHAFCALATLPLQDVELALAEFDRTTALGFAGVAIGSNIAGVELDDPRLEPFWGACARRDALVFIHPHHQVGSARMREYYLHNCVGNPEETGLAAARLIFGGVLERHRLRVVLSHAGGVLPQIVGRLDHAYAVRPECKTIPQPPSAYAARLFYDTIAHDVRALRDLIDRVGAAQVVVGTDAPFDMGVDDPGAVLDALELDARERDAIAFGNLRALVTRTAVA